MGDRLRHGNSASPLTGDRGDIVGACKAELDNWRSAWSILEHFGASFNAKSQWEREKQPGVRDNYSLEVAERRISLERKH